MNILLLYMVKTAAYCAGFYIVYFIFLSQDTNYTRNRIFLLSSMAMSFLLPLIIIPVREENAMFYFGKALSEVVVTAGRTAGVSGMEKAVTTGLMVTIFRIYLAGIIVFGIKLLADIISLEVMIIRKKGTGQRVIRFKGLNTAGFSAMGHIFISNTLSPAEEKEIIRHEQNHLGHYHFVDILLLEVVKVFQWFNPVIYMINRSLRAIHEYQADSGCLRSGMTVTRYQTLLLAHLLRSKIFLSSNSFSNPSLIRKRMVMMSKSRSGAASNLKLIFVIPVICFILFILSAFEINRDSLRNPVNISLPVSQGNSVLEISGPAVFHKPFLADDSPSPPKPLVKAGDVQVETMTTETGPEPERDTDSEDMKVPEEVFVVVEEMPAYSGGDRALMEFIYANVQYPQAAKEKGIEGRVILRFAVMADGNVDKVSVIRGIDPDLDNEAKRVVSLLQKWEPGRQGGKPVNVWYSVPITFKLQ